MSAQEILIKIVGSVVAFLRVLYWYGEALFRQFVPPSMKPIDGETILVTGAVGGIGKEICKHVLQSGSNIKLVIWDLNQTDLEKLAAELNTTGSALGHKVFPFAVDISERNNIDECCQKVKDTVGPVSIIFNNAGIAPTGNFLQLTNTQIEKTIDVNLMSHLWIIRQFLPDMVARNHGRIVNICSMGGLKAVQHALPYFASKFAVNGYTDSLKAELEMFNHDGIHTSTVYPYFVKTKLIGSLDVEKKNKSSKMSSAFQTFLEPEDVGRNIVDGMRREYEYIYLPPTIPILLFIDFILPMKARKAMQKMHFSSLTHSERDNQRLNMSYTDVIQSSGVNGKKSE